MTIASGLLALTMVAADGSSCPQSVETTTYQVRVLTLDGLEWRTSSYTRLQPVARQGSSTIWTADKALASTLADRAKDSSPCHVITAVGEAVMSKADVLYYNAALERIADGPMNQASAIAFMPKPEPVEERFSIKVEGRKLDQGVLTRLSLDDTHVDVIHTVTQTEALVPTPAAKKARDEANASKTPAEVGRQIINAMLAPGAPSESRTTITSAVKIPEVTHASVAGEWLIPNDGVLLVSLGVKTAADASGKAVVRERLAVIEACPGPDAAKITAWDGRAEPFQHVKLAQPVAPGRSMPEARDPSGQLVDLPPLPEAVASADLDRIKPEPYQPSPQAPAMSAPSFDSALARTGFDAAPAAPKKPAADQPPSILLSEVVAGLAKAGIKLEVDTRCEPAPAIAWRTCGKCGAGVTCLPADPKPMAIDQVAGGMKFAPAEPLKSTGVAIDEAIGDQILDFAAFLDSVESKEEARKLVGQTRTSVVPLGDNFTIELKATVLPAKPEPARAAKATETPATRR